MLFDVIPVIMPTGNNYKEVRVFKNV